MARKTLYWGIFLFFAGNFVGIGAILVVQNSIFSAVFDGFNADDPSEFETPDFGNSAAFLGIAGVGMVVSFLGLVLIVISLVMRREKIKEPIAIGNR